MQHRLAGLFGLLTLAMLGGCGKSVSVKGQLGANAYDVGSGILATYDYASGLATGLVLSTQDNFCNAINGDNIIVSHIQIVSMQLQIGASPQNVEATSAGDYTIGVQGPMQAGQKVAIVQALTLAVCLHEKDDELAKSGTVTVTHVELDSSTGAPSRLVGSLNAVFEDGTLTGDFDVSPCQSGIYDHFEYELQVCANRGENSSHD